MDKENQGSFFGDSTVIVRMKKKYELPDKTKVWESVVTDTGSSRTLWSKTYFKDGIGFALIDPVRYTQQAKQLCANFF